MVCFGGCSDLSLGTTLSIILNRHNDYVSLIVDFSDANANWSKIAELWATATEQLTQVRRARATAIVEALDPLEVAGRKLGEVVAQLPRNACDCSITCLSGSEEERLDFSSYIEYCYEPVAQGKRLRPLVLCSFRLAAIKPSLKSQKVDDIIVDLMLAIGMQGSVAGAAIDVANCWESGFGRLHGLAELGYASVQRRVDRALWLCDQIVYQPRGVFWANWLASKVLEQCEDLNIDRLLHTRRCQRLSDGSAIVCLCDSIQDMRFPNYSLPPRAIETAFTLKRALRQRAAQRDS